MKNQLINNNYSTLQLGNSTVQSLTINGETFVPVRELLVALGVTSKENVRDYMNSHNSSYYRNSTAVQTARPHKFLNARGQYRLTDSINVKDVFKFVDILEPRNKKLKAKAKAYFHKMEDIVKTGAYLTKQERGELIYDRKEYTDVIKIANTKEDGTVSNWCYKSATDDIYIALFGMNAVKIREELNLKKGANLRDYLSARCLRLISGLEILIAGRNPQTKEEYNELIEAFKSQKLIPIEVREDTKIIEKSVTITQRVLSK